MISYDKYNNIFKLLESNLEEGWEKQYLRKNQNRYFQHVNLIEQQSFSGIILEIGAYPFQLTMILNFFRFNIIGIDLNPDRSISFIKKNNLQIKKCDIEVDEIPFENNSVDTVLLFEVFEHLRIDPIKTLQKIYKILKPGGKLFLSTPNIYSIHTIVKFLTGYGIGDGFVEFNKIHELGHMGHVREYTKKELDKFLLHTGFTLDKFYRFSNKTRFNINFKKKILNGITDLIELMLPMLKTHMLFIAKKED